MIKVRDNDLYMIDKCKELLDNIPLRFDRKIFDDILLLFSRKYVAYKERVLRDLYNFILFHNTEYSLDLEEENRIKLAALNKLYTTINEEGNIEPVLTNLETINNECLEYKLNPLKLRHRKEKNDSLNTKDADSLYKCKEELLEATSKVIEEGRKIYLSANAMNEVLEAAKESKLSDEKIVEALREYYKFSLLCNTVIGLVPFADMMYKEAMARTLKRGLKGELPIEDGIKLMKGYTEDVFFYRELATDRNSLIDKCKRTLLFPEYRFTGDALKDVIDKAEKSSLKDDKVVELLKELYVFMIFQGTNISLDAEKGIETKLNALRSVGEVLDGTKPFEEGYKELKELNNKLIEYRMDPTLYRNLKEDASSKQ